ncbi:substrate-binding domain-containing protein [Pseudomonas graminis]
MNLSPDCPPAKADWLTADGRVRLSGSGHADYVLQRLTAAFTRQHPQVRFAVELHGTPSAMAFAINGKALFSVMGREITPVETVPWRKQRGADPLGVRVACAALDTRQHLATSLAVYVHHTNPLAQIDAVQLAKIFTEGNPGGDYSRWGQLGLEGNWQNRRIVPLTTHAFSGFGTYMQKHHFAGRNLSADCEYLVATGRLLARLAEEPAAICVAAIGCETPQLRALPLARDGAGPWLRGEAAEMVAGEYALGRYLWFYPAIQPDGTLDPLQSAFLRFTLSPEGQQIIASQPDGYLALSAADVAAELARLTQAEKH